MDCCIASYTPDWIGWNFTYLTANGLYRAPTLLLNLCPSEHIALQTTALAGKVKQSAAPVRLSVCLSVTSVCFQSIFWTDWPLNLDFCLFMGHDHRSCGMKTQGHRSRSRSRVRVVVKYWLTAVIVHFYCYVISCALAREACGVTRPRLAAAAVYSQGRF